LSDSKSEAAKDQHEVIGVSSGGSEKPFERTTHPDAQWFGNAGLGLFIHWGISTVAGNIDLSWGMMAGMPGFPDELERVKPTANEYFKLADRFKPDKYDPDKWLRTAKAAGFKYAVLTTKHHDGFTLWPSKRSDFGVQTSLPGVDLVGQYVAACRRNGLRVGLYYSPPDWHYNRDYMTFHYGSWDQNRFPGRPHYGPRREALDEIPEPSAEFEQGYRGTVRGHVVELLTHHGRIDVLFFDGGPDVISIDEIRELQPGIVVNPRMHGIGDFATPEGCMPQERPDGWWELCECWPDAGWGYDDRHEEYRPTGWMLSRFAQIRSLGGNYLINTGPKASGEMPDVYYERMAELTEWMKRGAESVFDTEPGPFPERVNVPTTIKGATWYLHVLPDFDGTVEARDVEEPKSATLLRTGSPVEHSFSGGTLTIDVPASVRTDLDDVVAVRW